MIDPDSLAQLRTTAALDAYRARERCARSKLGPFLWIGAACGIADIALFALHLRHPSEAALAQLLLMLAALAAWAIGLFRRSLYLRKHPFDPDAP